MRFLSLAARFSFFTEKTARCWLWSGRKDTGGYGRCWIGKKDDGAHRVSWRLHFGEIPKGLCVLHKCDVRHCVNPAHLFLGTDADNIRDAINKGRWRTCYAGVTHCKRGHAFNPENTYRFKYSDGHVQRQCKICNQIRNSKRRTRR